LTNKFFLSIFYQHGKIIHRWEAGKMGRHLKLNHSVRPVEVWGKNNLANLLDKMSKTAFQGKNLSWAVQVWVEMLKQETTILLGLAGALIPAGMRQLLVYLIQKRMIDCLVSTGGRAFDSGMPARRHSYFSD
jgi:deoxyhypusine synthase